MNIPEYLDVQIEGLKDSRGLHIGDFVNLPGGIMTVKNRLKRYGNGLWDGFIKAGLTVYRPTKCDEGFRWTSDEEWENRKQGLPGETELYVEGCSWDSLTGMQFTGSDPRHHYRIPIKQEPQHPPIWEGYRLADPEKDKGKEIEAYAAWEPKYPTDDWVRVMSESPNWLPDRIYIVKDKPRSGEADVVYVSAVKGPVVKIPEGVTRIKWVEVLQ